MAYHRAKQAFLSFGLPTVATTATFMFYSYLGNRLTAASVFTGVGLFEFLAMALVILPNLINEIKRVNVSIKRIERLLVQDDTFNPNNSSGDIGRVVVRNGNFLWGLEGTTEEKKIGNGEDAKQSSPKMNAKQSSPTKKAPTKDVELTNVSVPDKEAALDVKTMLTLK